VAAAVVQALTRPGFNLTRNALSLLDDGSLGWIQAAGVATGGAPHGSLTLFTGVSIALLWAAFTITRLTAIRSLP
jgi:hypothetical protein